MHYKTILAALAFGTAVLGATPPPGYEVSSSIVPSSSADPACTPSTITLTLTKYRKKTVTSTSTEIRNDTIIPPCPILTCTKPTTTRTVTSVNTVNRTITDFASATETVNRTIVHTITTTASGATVTATPSPIVELTAYPARSCAVSAVASNGNQPNFRDIQLVYDAATASSQCAKINGNAGSFSWDIVPSTADVSSSCHLYFYFGDSCFDDNGGSEQINLSSGEDSCHNIRGVKSVRLFC